MKRPTIYTLAILLAAALLYMNAAATNAIEQADCGNGPNYPNSEDCE